MIDEKAHRLTDTEETEQDSLPPDATKLWQLDEASLASKYKTDPKTGLSLDEAANRLYLHGRNELEVKRQSRLLQFIKQFNNSIIYILAAAAVMTFFMQRYSDSIVIGLVIIANAIIGYVQERQAGNA